MATTYHISFYGDADGAELQRQVQTELDIIEQEMSNWRATSDIMRLNQAPIGVWQTIPNRLFDVLSVAQDVHILSQGAFDLNVNDLLSAWGFRQNRIPNETLINTHLTKARLTQAQVLELNADLKQARLLAPAALDLSGIAKGYAVDQVAKVLMAFGVTHALVAIDGEIRAINGQADGSPWHIGVETAHDTERSITGMLELVDGSVASSGNYRHFHMINAQRFAHTMNPRTAAPVQTGPAAVTVLHQDCVYADALATVFMVLDHASGQRFAAQHGIDVIYPKGCMIGHTSLC